MNNQLDLFPEMDTQDEKDTYSLSCYQGLSEEAINRLENYVLDIHNIANKASFDLAIALCKARDEYRHNKHGGFEGWIDQALGWSRSTAYRIIDRYEQFGTVPNLGQLDIVLSAQYRLSGPTVPQQATEEAIELAESGEKITVAKANALIDKWQRIAEEKEKEAKDAQDQLGLFQAHSQLAQDKIDALSQQITDLEEKLRTAQTPEKKEVISQEILDKIANLETLIKKLKEQNQHLSNETDKLTAELRAQRNANEARHKQEQYEYKIKDGWKRTTEALYKALSQFVGQIPSPIAIQVFEGDEWARYDQIEHALKQFYEAFTAIKSTRYSSQFVDTSSSDDLVIYDAQEPNTIHAIPAEKVSPTETFESTMTPDEYKDLFAQYQQHVKSQIDDKLWWESPDSGIMSMEMSKEEHITYTRELLKSGDIYRISSAIECMKRTLGE